MSQKEGGGALWSGYRAKVTVANAKIHDNRTAGAGGAIRLVTGSTLTMESGELYGNHSQGEGGAIYCYNPKEVTISGGTITRNASDASVGGVFLDYVGSIKHYSIVKELISDNVPADFNLDTYVVEQ